MMENKNTVTQLQVLKMREGMEVSFIIFFSIYFYQLEANYFTIL